MKIYGVLIKSDNALRAEEEGRFPITQAKKVLRTRLREMNFKATLYGCEMLLKEYGDSNEWHHVSKFANEVDYYDTQAVLELFENPTEEILQIAAASKPKRQEVPVRKCRVSIYYKEWIIKHTKRSYSYEGEAVVKGNWIEFEGRRKLITGKNITVKYL